MSSSPTPRRPIPPLSPSQASASAGLSTAGHPHLIQLLALRYREFLATQTSPREVESLLGEAQPLIDFCERYLTENRGAGTFAVDMNTGLLLTNGERCVLCPGAPEPLPPMQDTGAIQI